MIKDRIKVFAPATVANVSCGFDILGFALHNPGDEIILERNDSGKLKIREITGDEGHLPMEVELNTASAVIKNILEHLNVKAGIDITLNKKMPLGSGLGSSAASAVAGAFAINAMMDFPLNNWELLKFTIQGEGIACGSEHADNVAPSLFGGFVLIRSYDPLDIVALPTPVDLYAAVIHPQIEIKTKDAREILRKEIQLKDAIKQWGNVGGLIAGLYNADYKLIGRSMQDHIIEPIRSILIPGYEEVKKAALESGVLGFGISGSGPSLFTLCEGSRTAKRAGKKMFDEFKKLGIESDIYVSKINSTGPKILD